MTTADQIAAIARTLPEPLAREVLDFIRAVLARDAPGSPDAGEVPTPDFDEADDARR